MFFLLKTKHVNITIPPCQAPQKARQSKLKKFNNPTVQADLFSLN